MVVRVRGRLASKPAVGRSLNYISRGGTLPALHSSGLLVLGREALRHIRDRWCGDNAAYATGRAEGTQALGVVLSMPAGTPLAAVEAAAHAWARKHLSPDTEWLAVAHADRAHPHVHVCVRAVKLDGRRLTASPAQVQQWRVSFAEYLVGQGVEADATSRHEKLERSRERRLEHAHERVLARALGHDVPPVSLTR